MKTKPPRLTINESRQEVFVSGREVRLARKEYEILCELKNTGCTLSRETLLETLWQSPTAHAINTRTVDQHIARMRRKIGRDFILTVPGYGYKFAA